MTDMNITELKCKEWQKEPKKPFICMDSTYEGKAQDRKKCVEATVCCIEAHNKCTGCVKSQSKPSDLTEQQNEAKSRCKETQLSAVDEEHTRLLSEMLFPHWH